MNLQPQFMVALRLVAYLVTENFLPSVYKFGMVYTLVYRCYRICSDWTQFHTEFTFLKGIFRKNVYLENFIYECRKKFFR